MTTLRTRDAELVASPEALKQARDFVGELHEEIQVAVRVTRDDVVAIPRELSEIISKVVQILAAGGTVTVGSVPDTLTTTAAAELLGISRPTLMKMVQRGDIPSHKVGTHTRLLSADVLAAKKARRAAQRAAFDALRALEADFDDE
jgi:excisionase family DNA binding protein